MTTFPQLPEIIEKKVFTEANGNENPTKKAEWEAGTGFDGHVAAITRVNDVFVFLFHKRNTECVYAVVWVLFSFDSFFFKGGGCNPPPYHPTPSTHPLSPLTGATHAPFPTHPSPTSLKGVAPFYSSFSTSSFVGAL